MCHEFFTVKTLTLELVAASAAVFVVVVSIPFTKVIDWNASHDPPIGKYGACCAEMDIWEANSRATAYTPLV